MAPTELLAEQHCADLSGWFKPLGVTVALLSGSQPAARGAARSRPSRAGEVPHRRRHARPVPGGHRVRRLALVIVDEQHRFGVQQRLRLQEKGTSDGRRAAPADHDRDADSADAGHDGVCRPRHLGDRRAAAGPHAGADRGVHRAAPRRGRRAHPRGLPRRAPGLLGLPADRRVRGAALPGGRGNRRGARRSAAGTAGRAGPRAHAAGDEGRARCWPFKAGRIQLLVATTVIEVGVDVPNATLMVIENAERMGLAQLHQLRGRVGRGAEASTCVLLYRAPLSQLARERLKVIRDTNDGFEIARRDLELRGPGRAARHPADRARAAARRGPDARRGPAAAGARRRRCCVLSG